MTNTDLEPLREGLARPVEPESELGGGGVDSPPAKRAWQSPSIRVLGAGGATNSGSTNRQYENALYFNNPCKYYAPGQGQCMS